MTQNCKFKKAHRGYKVGDTGDLQPDLAADLQSQGIVEITGGPPKLSPQPVKTAEQAQAEVGKITEQANKAIGELNQKLTAKDQEIADLKQQLAQATGKPPVADAATSEPADTETATELTAATAFPELDLPESIKQTMLDNGWQTAADVVEYGDKNGGLTNAKGVGKVTADEIKKAIKASSKS